MRESLLHIISNAVATVWFPLITGRGKWLLFGMMSLCLLVSCEKGKSPHSLTTFASVAVPRKWRAETAHQPTDIPDRFWVKDFGDHNLTTFVREALVSNHDIRAAQSRFQVAASTARITGADLFPTVNKSLSGQRANQNFIGLPFPGLEDQLLSSTSNTFSLSLDTNWEVDLWGRVADAQSAAIADMEASIYDRNLLQLSIASQAVKAWFLLAEARDQVKLAESTLKAFRNTEESVRDRFQTGLEDGNAGSFGSQLLLSQTDIETAKDALEIRRELIDRTSRMLELLAGKYPSAKAGKTARLPDFPKTRPLSVPCTVLDRRPDILAAERRLAAADERLVLAKKQLLPTISLTTSVGTQSDRFSQILNPEFSVWSLAGNILQPILSGGRIKNGIQQNYHQVDIAKNEFDQAILTAFTEVENALSAEKFFAKRVIALTKAAELSKEAYVRAGEEYVNGTGDVLTLITVQQRMFNQQSQLLTLKRQRLDARVDLHLAIAGSFESLPRIDTDADPLAP